MTREEAIKLLVNATYSDEWQGNEDLTAAHNMAIEALEMVEEFEKAQIITGGRLNGRTYAYKCGLEDGKRKALEQEPCILDDAREDFMHDVYNTLDFLPTNNEANRIIDSFDRVTSDLETTRKKGKWIYHEKSISTGFKDLRECSCCKCYFDWIMPRNSYCPNCGAEMESEE